MINQTVIVELNAEALLTKRFNIKEEIVSILEQGEDDYAALIEALKNEGITNVVDYLDKHKVPQAYIDVDYEHVEFRTYNVFGEALEFLVPFSFDAAELDLDIEENMVEEKNDGENVHHGENS